MARKQKRQNRKLAFECGDKVKVKATGEVGVIDHILEHPLRRVGSGLWMAGLRPLTGEYKTSVATFCPGIAGFANAFMFWELEKVEEVS